MKLCYKGNCKVGQIFQPEELFNGRNFSQRNCIIGQAAQQEGGLVQSTMGHSPNERSGTVGKKCSERE